MKHVKHVKYILPADWYIKQIPNSSVFGRRMTLRMNPDEIPDLHWSLADTYHPTNIGQIDSNATLMSINYINVDTLSFAKGDKYREWCGTTLNTNVTVLQSNREPIVCHAISCGEDNHENYLKGNRVKLYFMEGCMM